MGLKSPKLLFWGLIRFFMVVLITLVSASIILSFHQEIMDFFWQKPDSLWVVWLWHVLSWLLSLLLAGISAIIAYLIAQILFSVVIMDYMSRVTERLVTGTVQEPEDTPLPLLFIYLIKQEIPRAVIPILISMILMLGGPTPLGPVLAALSGAIAAVFLAWDNTDLLPARRLVTFKKRSRFLLKSILFHLGFGIPFLIPIANIFFLSFAPIGATLLHLENDGKNNFFS